MNPERLKYYVLLLLLFFLHINGSSQTPIELRRADLMRTETGTNGAIRYLDGDVWVVQDTLSVFCEHAIFEEESGRLFSRENVHFIEPTREMWADEAVYYEIDGRATAEGNVRIEQDSLLIFCDRVIYSEAREEAQLFGNVQIFSLPDDLVLIGDHGLYYRARERGMMKENPRLVRNFSEDDSLVIVGEIIEYLFATEYAVVTDNVVIERGNFNAWGDKLFYWNADERSRLIGSPLIKHERDVLIADTVDVYFAEKHLERAILTGQAVATSPVDSLAPLPVNKMTGKTIEITFIDDEVDSIYVRGNATSTYYIIEEGQRKGANRVSGDLIDMWMNERRVDWIYVEGGTEGVYFPKHLEHRVNDEDEPVPTMRGGH